MHIHNEGDLSHWQEFRFGSLHWILPPWLSGKDSACNAGDASSILGWGDPLEEGMATTPVFLPGKPWAEELGGL